MTSCLSSRACGFDLEHMVKWPCTHTSRTTSNSSSPSSTLSESSNSPIAISTRKPRTPRKRPNQTYNEAAALLSMACPNIFSTKHLTKRTSNLLKFTKHHTDFFNEPPDLISSLPIIESSGFLLRQRITEKPCLLIEPKIQSAGEIESNCAHVELSDGCLDDFDTESILDEEIEQGINSIMGDLENEESNNNNIASDFKTCYGYPIGLGFGVRNGVSALRNVDEGNWWSIPMVDVGSISTAAAIAKGECFPVGKKKKNNKKKKKVEELMNSESEFQQGNLNPGNGNRLGLRLDYDSVLNAWAGKGLPLPEELSLSSSLGVDIHARAASIDLFSDKGGWSESSATTRSMDKNHFKKIRHQLKNVCSDRRLRSKGRFVKKLNSTACDEKT